MIPIIGIPVLNRGDLLVRCIRSIDYPVGGICVINNGRDPGVVAALDQLQRTMKNLVVLEPGENLGCAASWNRVMREFPTAEYWLFAGNDIMFADGDLAKIDKFVQDHPHYATCPANWGHSLFAITQVGLDKIGWFDENFWPAYSEDQDHMYRVKLSGLSWADVPDTHATHGEPPSWGSQTVYADAELFQLFKQYQENNFVYYESKWGGRPGSEKYTHPYNDPDLTWAEWRIDRELAKANGREILEA